MKARPLLPDDIKQLMALVRAGKLLDVQKWIADGKRANSVQSKQPELHVRFPSGWLTRNGYLPSNCLASSISGCPKALA